MHGKRVVLNLVNQILDLGVTVDLHQLHWYLTAQSRKCIAGIEFIDSIRGGTRSFREQQHFFPITEGLRQVANQVQPTVIAEVAN